MLQRGSMLNVIDNTGAKEARCICILGGFFNKSASVGSLVIVSIRRLRLVRRVKVGQVHLGVVVKTRKSVSFKDGTRSFYNKNAIVLLTRKKQILGNKILGSVSRGLRKKKYLRILLVAGSLYF